MTMTSPARKSARACRKHHVDPVHPLALDHLPKGRAVSEYSSMNLSIALQDQQNTTATSQIVPTSVCSGEAIAQPNSHQTFGELDMNRCPRIMELSSR
jgi:hypothetical protein